jgi:hypothetical protein
MPGCFSHVPFFLLSLSCGSGDFIAFCESNSLANFPSVFNPVRVGLLAGAPPPPLHLKNVPHRMFGGGGGGQFGCVRSYWIDNIVVYD